MLSDNDDNHEANVLPFAELEIATDVHIDHAASHKWKNNDRKIIKRKSKKQQPNVAYNEKVQYVLSHIYFENMEEENNLVKFVPYTGPSNTLHLSSNLYIPQLISNAPGDLTINFQNFIRDYDRTIESLSPMFGHTSLSIYLRFGISYIRNMDTSLEQTMTIKDFIFLRTRGLYQRFCLLKSCFRFIIGKKIKTAFYTCKGVTSPKRLITEITKLNYQQISSNRYAYDVQLYGMKHNRYNVIHFQYDERFQCRSIYCRTNSQINFDFIRQKTSSMFYSIDDSYSDIFDFRIQLSQGKNLSKSDPNVLDILRGVPVDQVLYLDESTQVLYVSSKLQKFVRYLKCTRSSCYQNFDDDFVIHIGTYEEFQLNTKGQCEQLMTASNTMTIEVTDVKTIPSGKKLYDTGIWFSTLCQTCVDLRTTTTEQGSERYCKWFSGVFQREKNRNQSIKPMSVNQLTTYKKQRSQQTYTNEELAFVKKILREENLRNVLLNTNDDKSYNKKYVEERYESMTRRLKRSAAPSVNDALAKINRAYHLICKEMMERR